MKPLALFIIPIIIVTALSPLPTAHASPLAWNRISPGIDYQEFILPGPVRAFVARMERNHPEVTIESSIAKGQLASGTETVSNMAKRYDQAINNWGYTWGSRNRVVVAINGSYYFGSTWNPESGMVHSGWYSKRFDLMNPWSGFVWQADRSAFIGKCVTHNPDHQLVTFIDTGENLKIDGVNVPRQTDQLILYTPQYSSRTGTDSSGVEVVVEMTEPAGILPPPHFARGYIREIRDYSGSTPIPFDHAVISAHGQAGDRLLSMARIGDEIGLSQGITSYEEDCKSPSPLNWTKTYASISGAFIFLRDGEIHSMSDPGATYRHPRTAIALNDDYIFYIVVDGRIPGYSIGMSFDELAYFSKDILGAKWGIAEDGGGSSTMVVNGVVVNQPVSRCVYAYDPSPFDTMFENFLYLPSIGQRSDAAGVPSTPLNGADPQYSCQREVSNGMLMVLVEPKVQSSTFYPNETVSTIGPTHLRLGPGTNYGVLATLPEGASGQVVHHMNDLDGVLAKNAYWWKVTFGDTTGWVPEGSLVSEGLRVSYQFPNAVY